MPSIVPDVPDVPRLISTAEAAKRLRVTTRSIQRWAGEGLIPAMKMPGRTGAFVFTPDAIEAVRLDGLERDGVVILPPARLSHADSA